MATLTADKWAPLEQSSEDREKIWSKNRTFAGDVWFRFRHKPTALLGLAMIVLLGIFAFLGPFFTPYSYSTQNLALVNIPPLMKVYQVEGRQLFITPSLKLVEVDASGSMGASLPVLREEGDKAMTIFALGDREVALYYGSGSYVVCDEATGNIYPSAGVWNADHVLGTDALGRDILARLMYGTRVSLLVAFVSVLVNLCIGILYGGVSGYLGGAVDAVMMRIVDIISTIPLTLYVILIMMVFGQGLQSIVIALGLVYWVDMARVVRGQVLSLKQQEFVLAARTIGTSTKDILAKHLIPNAMGSILVTATMLIPSAIFMEAFLGYMGIGLRPPLASLGTMCNDANANLRTSPHELFIPAVVICLIMFAFNFVGDGLRDALDPKLKK